jgi:hypothetical protein
MSAAGMRALLEAGDVEALRSAWAQLAPHLPRHTRAQAEIVMHHARTQCEAVTLPKRAYSHRWLIERDLPSGLPDKLKPSAERLYPKVVTAVGIGSICSKGREWMQPALGLIRGAMEQAVQECYAEGHTDPGFVSARMAEARGREQKHLFGSLIGGR